SRPVTCSMFIGSTSSWRSLVTSYLAMVPFTAFRYQTNLLSRDQYGHLMKPTVSAVRFHWPSANLKILRRVDSDRQSSAASIDPSGEIRGEKKPSVPGIFDAVPVPTSRDHRHARAES